MNKLSRMVNEIKAIVRQTSQCPCSIILIIFHKLFPLPPHARTII